MPTVIDTWLTHKDSSLCQRVQDRIIKTYIDDFQKYAKAHQVEHVGHVFSSIPKQLGKKFKYTSVDPDTKTYPIKQALHLLNKAGITYQCFHTSAQSYPLAAEVDIKKFKVFFFDIGIAHSVLELDLAEWISHTVNVELFGFSAEQLVAQELISSSSPSQSGELFYWHNESASSNAEVDFIAIHKKNIIPLEVKSKVKGGMKSLHAFLLKHPITPYGIKISEGMFCKHNNLYEIPLYAVSTIK